MNRESITVRPEDIPVLAIGICQTVYGNTHVGVVHRELGGQLLFFHQAWHHQTHNQPLHDASRELGGVFLSVVPDIEMDRARAIAGLFRLIARTGQSVAYALRDDPQTMFDEVTGRLVMPNGKGLNCATFVLVLFRTARLPLVDTTDWPQRPEDKEMHERLIAMLTRTGASSDHIQAVREEIGCVRVRPEEVAGAGMYTHTSLPVRFPHVEAAGCVILRTLTMMKQFPGEVCEMM